MERKKDKATRNGRPGGETVRTRRTGVSRNTVRKYMLSGEPRMYGSTGNGRLSILEPYKPCIRERIEEYNLSGVRILEEIRAKGYSGVYTVLKDCCQTLRNDMQVKVVWRFEMKPDEQAQVDYGKFGPILIDGEMKNLYCLSMVLGYSRARYIEFSHENILSPVTYYFDSSRSSSNESMPTSPLQFSDHNNTRII